MVWALIFATILVFSAPGWVYADGPTGARADRALESEPRCELSDLSLTQAENGQRFVIASQRLISIRLPENPGTGYRWEVAEPDGDHLALQNSVFALEPGSGLGASGWRTLTFKATSPGTTQLRLKYWREWEGERSVTQRFEITLQVRD